MNPKRIQLLLLLGVALIGLHFSVLFAKEFCHFLTLSQNAPAHIVQWEIFPVKKRFALKADYSFIFKEKNWSGSFVLNPPYYLNEMAAFTELKKKAKEDWVVHFSAKNPNISALSVPFPFGLMARAAISLLVLIYFIILRRRIIPNPIRESTFI